MADQQVLIQYIDSALAAQHGSRPFKVGLRLAREYENKGWVKILNKPPNANPSLPIQSDKKRDNPLVKMPEEANLTKIAWITPEYIDAVIRKIGINLGFKVEHYSSVSFSAGHLMNAKFMIVESNIKGFTGMQLENLRCIQFQKKIPFAFRIVGYDNSQYFQQALMHSKLNVFATTQLFEYVTERHEDMVGDWFIEDKADYYGFWRKIDEIINPKPEEPLVVVEEVAPLIPSETGMVIILESTELVAKHNVDFDKKKKISAKKKKARTDK